MSSLFGFWPYFVANALYLACSFRSARALPIDMYIHQDISSNQTDAPPHDAQHNTTQDELFIDKINVMLASIGILLAFATFVVAVLQCRQSRPITQPDASVQPSVQVSMDMQSLGLSYATTNRVKY